MAFVCLTVIYFNHATRLRLTENWWSIKKRIASKDDPVVETLRLSPEGGKFALLMQLAVDAF